MVAALLSAAGRRRSASTRGGNQFAATWPGREDGRVAQADRAADLAAPMWKLTARFALPGPLPDPDQAIRLACELLVRDLGPLATVSVAALSYGTTLRDAGQLIRDMLAEQGLPLPGADATDHERRGFMIRACGNGGLEFSEFFGPFMHGLPSWEHQNQTKRDLVGLCDALDYETSPDGHARVMHRCARWRRVMGGKADRGLHRTSGRTVRAGAPVRRVGGSGMVPGSRVLFHAGRGEPGQRSGLIGELA